MTTEEMLGQSSMGVHFNLDGDEDQALRQRKGSISKRQSKSCMSSESTEGLTPSSSSPAVLASSFASSFISRGLRTLQRSSTQVKSLVERVGRQVPDCSSCRDFNVCHEHGSYSLLKYDETPEYMKGNLYVISGYRPEGFSTSMCLQSLFHLNNETVNIWSHIVGFFMFAYYLVYDNVVTLPSKNAMWHDHIIISLGLICFMICMAMSACFHLFWCISESTHNTWLCLDLLGVTFGILGCYVTGIHYAFYCFQLWHNTYMSIFLFLTLITILAPFHPEYAHAKFYWARLSVYLLVGVYGVIPTIHWVAQHGGLQSEFSQRFLPSVLVVYGLCALGVAFYILMIPERWLPGNPDDPLGSPARGPSERVQPALPPLRPRRLRPLRPRRRLLHTYDPRALAPG